MTREELKPGDTVVPRRGRGGPWVIESIGVQPTFLPDVNVKVAVFKGGSFMPIEKLKLHAVRLKTLMERIVDEWLDSEFTRDLIRNTPLYDLLEELAIPAKDARD